MVEHVIRGLFVDLDDTLYDYEPCEKRGRAALAELATARFNWSPAMFEEAFQTARKRVKERFSGPSGHHRLLYIVELLSAAGELDCLAVAREWERAYWSSYLDGAVLRHGAQSLLDDARAHGAKVAIVTDLVLEVQLWKLTHFDLFRSIDALAVSEEVGHDKPHRAPFDLASHRMGIAVNECIVIGDNPKTDGDGAKGLGIPYLQVKTHEGGEGMSLADVRAEVWRMNRWTP